MRFFFAFEYAVAKMTLCKMETFFMTEFFNEMQKFILSEVANSIKL